MGAAAHGVQPQNPMMRVVGDVYIAAIINSEPAGLAEGAERQSDLCAVGAQLEDLGSDFVQDVDVVGGINGHADRLGESGERQHGGVESTGGQLHDLAGVMGDGYTARPLWSMATPCTKPRPPNGNTVAAAAPKAMVST